MMMTERKKRGRPRKPRATEAELNEIVDELTNEIDLPSLQEWLRRRRGGRRANHDLNQSLVEGWADAKHRGMSKQAFLRKFVAGIIAGKHGRAATSDEVLEKVSGYTRRLDRQLRRAGSKSRPNIKKRVLSEKSIF
jgi:hypothetical protein